MQKIMSGLKHFQQDVFPHQKALFETLSGGQHPRALFVTCGDSRLVPTLFTQTDPGELFISRQVGNIIPPHGGPYGGASATVEYAVAALKVKHIIVCGHTDCGAMKAVLHPESLSALPNVARWLNYSESARLIVESLYPDATEAEKLHHVTEQNVLVQMHHLETHPPVAVALARGDLSIHGWVYHIEDGDVDAYNPESEKFERITFNDDSRNSAAVEEEVAARA